MQEYQFRVIETRTYEMIYTVEADSPEEAMDMAHDGETVAETEIKLKDVIDRVVYDEVTQEERSYRVRWEMDFTASSPEDAARQALNVQRNPESEATYFEVEHAGTGKIEFVDLLELDDE